MCVPNIIARTARNIVAVVAFCTLYLWIDEARCNNWYGGTEQFPRAVHLDYYDLWFIKSIMMCKQLSCSLSRLRRHRVTLVQSLSQIGTCVHMHIQSVGFRLYSHK
jgi:hypothetical protein